MAGERLVNRIRLAYALAGLTMAVAARGINTPGANQVFLLQGLALLTVCGAVWLHFRLRPDAYSPWLKYPTILADLSIVHLSVLAAARNHSGVIEYFDSFFPIVLVLFNLLSGLRYSVAACLYSTGLTALMGAAVLLWVTLTGQIPISHKSLFGVNAINLADEAMRVAFVSVAGLVGAVLARIARDLIIQAEAAVAERSALEQQKTRLSKYLGGELAEAVLGGKGAFALGGSRRPATILFTDIRNFTAISERGTPESTVSLLNEYFTEMVGIVFAYGGTLDKFLGDGLMAVYGVPFACDRAPLRAVLTAVEMVLAVARVRDTHGADSSGGVRLRIGAGIASGEVIAGNIGSMERMEYTVIGGAVNLAARLELLNRELGTSILISQQTAEEIQAWIPILPLPPRKIRGLTGDRPLYSVDPQAISSERLAELRRMLQEGVPAAPLDPTGPQVAVGG